MADQSGETPESTEGFMESFTRLLADPKNRFRMWAGFAAIHGAFAVEAVGESPLRAAVYTTLSMWACFSAIENNREALVLELKRALPGQPADFMRQTEEETREVLPSADSSVRAEGSELS